MRIPLFPLHVVLAPGVALPLHVFEPRYRRMVRRCLDASEPFGIVRIRRGSETIPRRTGSRALALARVGTFAEIREAELLVDGRWNLLAVGSGRFRVRSLDCDHGGLWESEVDPLPDEPGDAAAARELADRAMRRFTEYLGLLRARDGEEGIEVDVRVEVDAAPDGDDGDDAPEVGADAGAGPVAGGRTARRSGTAASDPDGPDDDPLSAITIPDDPSVLSFLLTGIVQVELDRKQELLEAASAEERLRALDLLLEREIGLLRRRLAPYVVDRSLLAGRLS